MPHINIKHFPAPLSETQRRELIASMTNVVAVVFGCDPGVVSIALEPIEPAVWRERVYTPEIVERKTLLCKTPNY